MLSCCLLGKTRSMVSFNLPDALSNSNSALFSSCMHISSLFSSSSLFTAFLALAYVASPVQSNVGLECLEEVFYDRLDLALSQQAYRYIPGSSPNYNKNLKGFVIDLKRPQCPAGSAFKSCVKGTKNCYFVSA